MDLRLRQMREPKEMKQADIAAAADSEDDKRDCH